MTEASAERPVSPNVVGPENETDASSHLSDECENLPSSTSSALETAKGEAEQTVRDWGGIAAAVGQEIGMSVFSLIILTSIYYAL